MRNLISHFIQENYAGGKTRGHFPAAGLFLDLSGFTATTEVLMEYESPGAEALVVVLQSIFGPLVEIVHAQGGFIARTAGDAFTALFSLENDPLACPRALAAAWQMQQHMSAHPVHHTPFGSFAIQARVGLGVGQVNWGILTSPEGHRATYFFQGSAVDVSALAEHTAAPGEIILEARLFQQVQELLAAEPAGDFYRLREVTARLPAPLPVSLPAANPQAIAPFFPEALISETRSGEFRQVVSLFISLPTICNETQLAAFIQTVFELQDRYGGLLNSLDFGDKGSNLLLLWGAPAAYENDIERALSFITDLQIQTSIPINAGVTYHPALAGFLGSPILDEYNCFGRGINLAARLMTSARRGEIWTSQAVASRAQAYFDFERIGELTFKGFQTPQPIYLLLERKEQQVVFFRGKMIGRQAEMQALERFIAPLQAGKSPGMLAVIGEAGIGKSRLVHEFQDWQSRQPKPALWALCQTSEILRQPFNPLRYWLMRYLDQSEGQAEARGKRSFNRKLDDLIAEIKAHHPELADRLDQSRSFLGALVDLHWADSLYEQLDPQGRYENTLLSLTSLLYAESLRQPVILLLEDAHWLDEDTRAFLTRLDRSLTHAEAGSFPLAVIATARDEDRPALLGENVEYARITLSGMSQADLASLAEDILGGPASADLLELLVTHAEGNPFFAEHILQYLKEAGLLLQEAGQWDLKMPVDQAVLPADIGAVLVARLDRLDQEVKSVVQTASILGREFEPQLLARMLQDNPQQVSKMADATQAAIWTALDERHYMFKHALVCEAAYRMQVSARRQALHTQAVAAIEELYAHDLKFHYAELAFHSQQANLPDKARTYLRLAGDSARDAYLNSQALDYYSQSLSLTAPDDLPSQYTLRLERIPLLRALGRTDPHLQELKALDQLAGALDDLENQPGKRPHQAEVLELWAHYYTVVDDYPNAIAVGAQAIAAASAAGAGEIAIEAYIDQSYSLMRLGKHTDANQQSLLALELSRQEGYKKGESLALNQLGLIATETGDAPIARTCLEQCLQMAGEINDLRLQGASLANLGNLAGNCGEFIDALAYLRQALELARQIGDRSSQGVILGNLGWISSSLGDYASARQYFTQNLKLTREVGNRYSETYGLINLSASSGRLGDLQNALEYARAGLALANEIGDLSAQAWAQTYLGHALLESNDLPAARQAYTQALATRQSLAQPNLACEPQAGLAHASLLAGDTAQAREITHSLLTHLQGDGALDGADEPLRVYLRCYQVLQAAGDPQADSILENAHSLLLKRADGIPDPALRHSFLEDIPYHRTILTLWEGARSPASRPGQPLDREP